VGAFQKNQLEGTVPLIQGIQLHKKRGKCGTARDPVARISALPKQPHFISLFVGDLFSTERPMNLQTLHPSLAVIEKDSELS
jgi:hypothetical protein